MDTCIDQTIAATATVKGRLRNNWCQLLDVSADQVAADSSFFALGGNSMLVLSLHVTVANEFNITITLTELLENVDFDDMASLICKKLMKEE
jgi:acyl carrier protein